MKKITMFMAIFIFMANCATAQDTIAENDSISSHDSSPRCHLDFTPSYHRYGSQYDCIGMQLAVMKEVSDKWAVGGGWLIDFFNRKEFTNIADESLPFNKLRTSTGKFGVFAAASYSTSFGIFMTEAWFGRAETTISAYDDRCEIEVETENSSYITNEYQLSRNDGKKWNPTITGSLALSYMIPLGEFFRLKFSVEYEFLPRIRKELVNDNVEFTSSNWDDFEAYYGHPVTNLYEASEDVRRICSISQFNVGIGFCIHL